MYIVLVEDDHLQAEWVESCLDEAFEDLRVERISTESGFYSWLQRDLDERPVVFIIDVMLRWADPSPVMAEMPPAVKENGFYRAGVRCQKEIANDERLRDVPVILYTVLEDLDLEEVLRQKDPNVAYLRKDSLAEPLIRTIRQYTRR